MPGKRASPKSEGANDSDFISSPELLREFGIPITALKSAALNGLVRSIPASRPVTLFHRGDAVRWHNERIAKNGKAQKKEPVKASV
jgi:hypothetical protein